ncbi:glycine cleavage system H protein, mitochondrial [Scaptodrosophila lebanonensis]|uniref:Glycine cleavage system H protein n=1 Tax=Drosophila lebanonensis TaxID=7225 RepID=A0A6J2TBG5_DROLE|nr:glycine cleavage system H protein, mitochondrial [Scaptodrosophila lebanonensis]
MVFLTKFARFGIQAARQLRAAPLATPQWRSIHVSSFLDAERRYTDKHEWVELVTNNTAIVGISSYAQEALGDVVFAQLPDVGTELKQDDECGALESVKAASEVYSPVSGKVTEKNNLVEDTPALVNTSCYEKGWLFKVSLKNPDEVEKLMTEEQYKTYLTTSTDH